MLHPPLKTCYDIDEVSLYLANYVDLNAHHELLITTYSKPPPRGLFLFDDDNHMFIHQSGRKAMNPNIDHTKAIIMTMKPLPLDYFHITTWSVSGLNLLKYCRAFFSVSNTFDWVPPPQRTLANAMPWMRTNSVAILTTPLNVSKDSILLPSGEKTARWELQDFASFTKYIDKSHQEKKFKTPLELQLLIENDFPEIDKADLLVFVTSFWKSIHG